MSKWKEFENDCVRFLRENMGDCASFEHKGESDSTTPDILVTARNGHKFYIEAKDCPAQCGQFVLLPNSKKETFEFSNLNSTPFNEVVGKIVEYMNSRFNQFKEAGTKGKDINIENGHELFSKWIVDKYKKSNVRFFITNKFNIYKIDDFSCAFISTAKYRVKRSGSSSVGKGNILKVKEFLINNFPSVNNITVREDKVFVNSEHDLDNIRFKLGKIDFFISARDRQSYEIRKLSNTFNANVIFSIDETENANSLSFNELKLYLEEMVDKSK